MRPVRRGLARLERFDHRVTSWMHQHSHRLERRAIGALFAWFGLNKLLGFTSATSIIAETVYLGTPETTARMLGLWELAIGLCLVVQPLARVGLGLLAIRLPGTLLALVLKADTCWDEPFVPTIQGQYLIKDVVLITAAMVIGGTLRAEHRVTGVRH